MMICHARHHTLIPDVPFIAQALDLTMRLRLMTVCMGKRWVLYTLLRTRTIEYTTKEKVQ